MGKNGNEGLQAEATSRSRPDSWCCSINTRTNVSGCEFNWPVSAMSLLSLQEPKSRVASRGSVF